MDSIALANGSGKTNPDDPRAPMNQVQPEGGPFENAGPNSEKRDSRLSHCGKSLRQMPWQVVEVKIHLTNNGKSAEIGLRV